MRLEPDILVEDSRWHEALDVERLVVRAIDAVIEATKEPLSPETEISFLFADDARLRELNGEWRHKDAPTNVLSFPASAEARRFAPVLGDVALSFETIEREAQRDGTSFENHTLHMIVHGLLHLLRYDHEDEASAGKMEALESRVLVSLGAPDPWSDGENKRAN